MVQARCHPGAAALLERRGQDKHETRKASLRVLKRHLSDVIYRALNADAWRLDQPAPHAASGFPSKRGHFDLTDRACPRFVIAAM